MPLTLKISTSQKDILGPESIRVFSVHGGSIGRAADNEWVLPDPDRYMSSHHALIDYKSGCYYLTDTSTNGVFVNDSDQPVGKGTPIRLYDGDRLRMGEYQFLVSIVNVSRDGTNDTGVFIADDTGVFIADDATTGAGSAERRPDTFTPPPEPELRGVDFDDYATPGKGNHPFEVLEPETAPSLPVPDEAMAMDKGNDPGAVTHPNLQPDGGGLDTAVQLLADATGIDPDLIPVGGQKKFLVTVGHLVRVTAQGLLDVMRSRAQIKGQLHLSQTAEQPRENNPLKFAADVEDALDKLLFYKGIHHLPAVDAFEGAFLDVRAHQHATVVAMKAAFDHLLQRFDPGSLEDTFNRGLRPGALIGMSNRAKYWDLYGEFYQSVERDSEARFNDVVGQVFVTAYESEIRRLTGDGADAGPGAGDSEDQD